MALEETLMGRRKQGAIEDIARTALELFTRDGFDATSVEAIAAAAGCSPRTFYRYFGTKEDVMFHDLPGAIERMGESLDRHLAEGLRPWEAASEAVVEFIGEFDTSDQRRRTPTQRMQLWVRERALGARYMMYVHQAERVVMERLHRHSGTTPQQDDLPELIAIAAIGATRMTLLTHTPIRGWKLGDHLRRALDLLGSGLADKSSQEFGARARSAAQPRPATARAAKRRRAAG